jgi:hypothetical protein
MAAEHGARSGASQLLQRALTRLRFEVGIRASRTALPRLAQLYDTDKAAVHGYMEHYARHFAPVRRTTRTVLEVGVGRGGSLKMWRTYFPKATVYGMDQKLTDSADGRVRILHGDQGERDDLLHVADVVGTPDVIIDDGSHVNDHVRLTFQTLFPYLAPGGYYVIEDLHAAYDARFGGAPPGCGSRATSMGLVKDMLDGLNHEHFGIDGYVPTYAEEHVGAVHAYEKIAFIEKRREDAT